MIETLLVSKPIAPPWNDSGKVLVRDLARHCSTVRHHLLTVPGFKLGVPHVVEEAIYRDSGRFSPPTRQNLRVLARLLRPDRIPIYHFFFAPNPRTSAMARAVVRLKKRRSVQTVMSVPAAFTGLDRLLFADRVVALSEDTRARLEAAGVGRVVHIPPAVDIPEAPPAFDAAEVSRRIGAEPGRPLVVFPGDYEFSRAAETFAGAVRPLLDATDAVAVFACRAKRRDSVEQEQMFRERFAPEIRAGRVCFPGEIAFIRELLAAAAVVTLPAESTYAKMDLPLVLIEAMAEGTPVVVADVAPLREVLGTDGARPDRPAGRAVPPLDSNALAQALIELVRDEPARRLMGDSARTWARSRFGVRDFAAAHAALYRDLVGA